MEEIEIPGNQKTSTNEETAMLKMFANSLNSKSGDIPVKSN
jgi:hypothetical protein